MKHLVLIIAAILLTGMVSGQIAYDKKLHIGAGAVAGIWGTFAGNSLELTPEKAALFGVGSAVVAGVGKELWDYSWRIFGDTSARFDPKDLGATVIGGVIGAGLSYAGLKIYYHYKPQVFTASVGGRMTMGVRITF